MGVVVECRGVTKSYGSTQVLRGVDFAVQAGEVVTIVGPSGAGKTTLLQILGTLAVPSAPLVSDSSLSTAASVLESGVWVDGVEVSRLSDRELSRMRGLTIGFVFQFHHLLPEFSALENVCIPGYLSLGRVGSPFRGRRDVERRAAELLAAVGMTHRADGKPAELSGGEQQRVAVARALINSPKVIFADEPSGNLDSVNRRELHELFFSLRDALGCAFVIVTHDTDLAHMSDRCVEMRDGRIVE